MLVWTALVTIVTRVLERTESKYMSGEGIETIEFLFLVSSQIKFFLEVRNVLLMHRVIICRSNKFSIWSQGGITSHLQKRRKYI